MQVHLIQFDIKWERIQENLRHLDSLLESQVGKTDLLVLPEMFTTGFSMQPKSLAEELPGITSEWMSQKAAQYDCAITGSYIVKENDRFYNRMLFVFPDGSWHTYDKKHLFQFEKEDENYTAGDRQVLVPYQGMVFCLQICYDLRFPVWSRNRNNYDVLLYIANWPDSRMTVFDTLLRARAIENQAYVIGVNRIGRDENPISYNGHTTLIDYKGRYVVEPAEDREAILSGTLDKEALDAFREKFPVWKDADDFRLSDQSL